MNPKADDLKDRTHRFFMAVLRYCRTLPQTMEADSIREQLLDSAGSTDSNYRACCRARSKREFIAKVGTAAEEADESLGWLKALQAAELGNLKQVKDLVREAHELTSIFVKSGATASKNLAAEEARKARRKELKARKKRR